MFLSIKDYFMPIKYLKVFFSNSLLIKCNYSPVFYKIIVNLYSNPTLIAYFLKRTDLLDHIVKD